MNRNPFYEYLKYAPIGMKHASPRLKRCNLLTRNYHAFPVSDACQISVHKLLLFDALRQNLLQRVI